jgi:hypothetical protein
MKNISIFPIITLAFAGLFLTNCNQQSKNLVAESYSDSNAKKSIVAENEIATAQKDTYSDYQKFIKDAYSQLGQNEISILKLESETNDIDENSTGIFRSGIEDLKTSNNTLKRQLDEYVENGSGNWQTFES